MQYLLTEDEFKKLDDKTAVKVECNRRMEVFFEALNLRFQPHPFLFDEKLIRFTDLQKAVNVAREEAKT